MSSPLDNNEVEALMQAIQEGRVSPESGEPGSGGASAGPVLPYDLTSQDRIIRGQMPTLDSINDRIASLFGKNLAGRTRLDVRVAASPATLLKFADVGSLLNSPGTVGVMTLGAGHGLALLVLEGELGRALLAGALGDRKARTASPEDGDGPTELTNLEKMVLKHLLGMLSDAMGTAWTGVLSFKPEIMRFESDPRMVMIANPSDVIILCSFEIAGAIDGRIQLALPYSAVEPAKKMLTSPPRLGGQRDARFSTALARELDGVEVELRVQIGRRKLSVNELLTLAVGDVITLNTSETAPLPVFVQGRPKMTASPRVVGGGMAIEILRAINTPPPAAAGRPGRPSGANPTYPHNV
jgi:flagellar motor switch protein FliM